MGRLLHKNDVYEYYFQDIFASVRNMSNAFSVAKTTGGVPNQDYIDTSIRGYYDVDDINAYFKFQEEKENTVLYAKQVVIDIISLYEYAGLSGGTRIVADMLGYVYQVVHEVRFSYERSLEIIEKFKDRFSCMDIESVIELRKYNDLQWGKYQEVA